MTFLFKNMLFLPFFISITMGFAAFFILYYLVKNVNKKKNNHVNDITKIAGDNVWATKLDLARAYLEIGESTLAKDCILEVVKKGDSFHRQEATTLLKAIQ